MERTLKYFHFLLKVLFLLGRGSFSQGFICKDQCNTVCMQTCRKEIKTISNIEKAYLSLCFFQLSLLTPSASLHD